MRGTVGNALYLSPWLAIINWATTPHVSKLAPDHLFYQLLRKLIIDMTFRTASVGPANWGLNPRSPELSSMTYLYHLG